MTNEELVAALAAERARADAAERQRDIWERNDIAKLQALCLVSVALAEDVSQGGGVTLLDVHERVRTMREDRDLAIARLANANERETAYAGAAIAERAAREKAEAACAEMRDAFRFCTRVCSATYEPRPCAGARSRADFCIGCRLAELDRVDWSGSALLAELTELRAEHVAITQALGAEPTITTEQIVGVLGDFMLANRARLSEGMAMLGDIARLQNELTALREENERLKADAVPSDIEPTSALARWKALRARVALLEAVRVAVETLATPRRRTDDEAAQQWVVLRATLDAAKGA